VLVALAGCVARGPAPAPAAGPPRPAPPQVEHLPDGRCEPMPRAGDACDEHGYCVISWGEPGGHSSALWCRGGRWSIEEEVNLE
jgi:hypothetical protein